MKRIIKIGMIACLSSICITTTGQDNQVKQRKINIPYERTKSLITYEGQTVVVTPAHSTGPVVNPGKGWVAYGSPLKQPPEVLEMVSMGYNRYNWGSLEPEEGKFNWERIDSDIKAWADAGKAFAFGIMGANSHSRDFWVTPKWVFDAGAKYDTFDLRDPKLETTGTPGLKLVPVFTDPIYMEKLRKFIKTLAERYDGNPSIAFIDIRSYGNWGEAHMHPFGKPELTPDEFKEHIQIHRDAFKKTLLVVPGGKKVYQQLFDWAVETGVGIRRDGILGNSDGSETARCDGRMPGVFEFFGPYEMMVELGWWFGKKDQNGYGYRLDECVERGKPSYCDLSRGGASGLNMMKKEPDLVNELANRMGYHFVLTEARYPKSIAKGKSAAISMNWENRGVAYIFIPSKVSYALLNREGKVVDLCDATASIPSKWKSDTPATATDNVSFTKASKGEYILAVGIRRHQDDLKPSIKIGIDQKSYDGWYELGPVKIK